MAGLRCRGCFGSNHATRTNAEKDQQGELERVEKETQN